MITKMTEGSPAKQLWLFSLPMLLSVAFQQIYNIADTVIVGNFVGREALSAVGESYPVTMLFLAIASGISVGASVVISQLFGAGDYVRMKCAVSTSLIANTAVSLVLTAAGVVFCAPILRALSTPDNIFADSDAYLRIYILGLVFLFLYNIANGIFTALGDSRTPLVFLIVSSALNIALDLLFVVGFDQGVTGAAVATLISQAIASVMSFAVLMLRLKEIKSAENTENEERFSYFSAHMLARIARIALPSVLQQSFVSVGNLLIQSIVNRFSGDVIAGYTAAIKLNTFAITSFTAMTNGLSSFIAQNIGAGKTERVSQGFRAGAVMMICVALPFTLVYTFAGGFMTSLFVDSAETGVIDAGRLFLRVVAPFYVTVALKLISDGVLRGSGAMKHFMTATFTDLFLRVILAFALAPAFGELGIWLSWPIGWIISAAMSFIFYLKGCWKKTQL